MQSVCLRTMVGWCQGGERRRKAQIVIAKGNVIESRLLLLFLLWRITLPYHPFRQTGLSSPSTKLATKKPPSIRPTRLLRNDKKERNLQKWQKLL